MILSPGSHVRITPDSPYFPTFAGKVSADGSTLVIPHGHALVYNPSWDGYKSAEGSETTEGDPTWTRFDFDQNGTGRLWECLPCHVVYEFIWGYELESGG
jgi:hypothetical protein